MPILANPSVVKSIGVGLDHPECVCVGPDGSVYAGGEAGQLYRITPDGKQSTVANTGGFLLGLALDGHGRVHACDMARKAVVRIDPDGKLHERAGGFDVPNYPVFDAAGNLFVSDSGEYWNESGTGKVYVVRPDNRRELFHAGPLRFANGLAIDPTGRWLYVVQSTAWNVVRVPLERPNGPIEVAFQLPKNRVADGLAFADDGRLVISCYRPDEVYVGHPDGRVELLIEDQTHELLISPTNVALHGGRLYMANLGGWSVSYIETDMRPAPPHRPML